MWGRCPISDSIDLKFITFMNRYGNKKAVEETFRLDDFTMERPGERKNITQELDLTGIKGIHGILISPMPIYLR